MRLRQAAVRGQDASPLMLIIRLGAMGDIIHALPAVASLKQSFPAHRVCWLVAPRWMPLLEGNPSIDELIPFEWRNLSQIVTEWREVRRIKPELAIDFQGLVQSALAGRLARPGRLLGFDRRVAREPLASLFYTMRVPVTGPHRIQRNLQLAQAAGARVLTEQAWIPAGTSQGKLPKQPFVLASPFAGWESKQWPLAFYDELGKRLASEGCPLVINVPQERKAEADQLQHVEVHASSLSGLIDATRRAAAVVGVDSGPLHLAAALKKPGVALYGPTDPAQTGPFDSPIVVLRQSDAETTYKRAAAVHQSMGEIKVEQVFEALRKSLAGAHSLAASAVRR